MESNEQKQELLPTGDNDSNQPNPTQISNQAPNQTTATSTNATSSILNNGTNNNANGQSASQNNATDGGREARIAIRKNRIEATRLAKTKPSDNSDGKSIHVLLTESRKRREVYCKKKCGSQYILIT